MACLAYLQDLRVQKRLFLFTPLNHIVNIFGDDHCAKADLAANLVAVFPASQLVPVTYGLHDSVHGPQQVTQVCQDLGSSEECQGQA